MHLVLKKKKVPGARKDVYKNTFCDGLGSTLGSHPNEHTMKQCSESGAL